MNSPNNVGPPLLVLTVAVIGVTSAAGLALGLGMASLLAAMVALFCLIASLLGSLWPDMRRLAWLGPWVVLAAAVPRFLASWHYWAGVAALVVALFLITLLQVAGPRYRIAVVGFSYAVIAGFGLALPTGTSDAAVLWAAVLGLGVAAVLRILLGWADPSRYTRDQLAAPLIGDDFDSVGVIDAWILDRPSTWTTGVLGGAFGYRRAVDTAAHLSRALPPDSRVVVDEHLDALRDEARATAALVTARHPGPVAAPPAAGPSEAHAPISGLLTEAREHLADVRRFALARDQTPWTEVTSVRRRLARARRSVALRPEAGVVSEATAKAVGVCAAAASGLQIVQPAFANTYFNAVVSMLQPNWSATFTRVIYRILGSIVGIVAVVLVAVYLPPAAMYVVAIAGLLVLIWFVTTHPIVSAAGAVAMSVALTSTGRHLDPLETLVHLLIIVAAASMIVLVVSIPSMIRAHRETPEQQIAAAVSGVDQVLAGLDSTGPDGRYRAFVLGSTYCQRLRGAAPGMAEPYRDIARETAALLDALVLIVVVEDLAGVGATARLCAAEIHRRLADLPATPSVPLQ